MEIEVNNQFELVSELRPSADLACVPLHSESVTPDLSAKLAGEQTPRGWGLFLIKNMVNEMNVIQDENQHTIELVMKIKIDD